MASRRPRGRGPERRPSLPLVLSIVAGAATAGVAGGYTNDALGNVRRCGRSSVGPGCTSHAFWGFAPEQFLAACLIGIVAGALIAVVGVLTYRRALRGGWSGYVVIAASFAGIFSYGGFGIGIAAGLLAGWLLAGEGGGAEAPAEWSGSLPAGVPPAKKPTGRALPPRPPVAEWDGIVAAPSAAPGRAGRPRAALPTADRLAEALRRSRISTATSGSASGGRPPTVVLPPPPLGLRGSVRTGSIAGSATAPARPPASSANLPARAPSGSSPARYAPEAREVGAGMRGAPSPLSTAAAVDPDEAMTRSPTPRPELSSPARPPRPSAAESVPRASRGPLREFRPATLASVSDTSAPEPEATEPREEAALTFVPPAALPPDLPIPATPAPASPPRVATPPGLPPVPPPAFPEFASSDLPPPTERPPAPSGSHARSRSRAWRCPSCKLVNAPWSPICTRCKITAPA